MKIKEILYKAFDKLNELRSSCLELKTYYFVCKAFRIEPNLNSINACFQKNEDRPHVLLKEDTDEGYVKMFIVGGKLKYGGRIGISFWKMMFLLGSECSWVTSLEREWLKYDFLRKNKPEHFDLYPNIIIDPEKYRK
jgi:hypothetical protein